MKKFFQDTNEHIIYNCFWTCFISICICIIFFTFTIVTVKQQIARDTDTALKMVAAYLASATTDEYDQVAQKIRQDLIFRTMDDDTAFFIQNIPNTASDCPTCQSEYQEQASIVAPNTGNIYPLDISPEYEAQSSSSYLTISHGYDEISQSSLNTVYNSATGECITSLNQGRDIVSIHRMKNIFCDDCIQKILSAIDNQTIKAFVLFIPSEQAFYPASDSYKQ